MFLRSIFLISVLMLSQGVFAQWAQIAPGIEYQKFDEPGPREVYVARMEITHTSATIESCFADSKLSGLERQTVSGMASNFDDSISYWSNSNDVSLGEFRNDVKIAINGDFFQPFSSDESLVPESGQIYGGSYVKRFREFGGTSGFVFQLDRDVAIGGCVNHTNSKQLVSFPRTGNDMTFGDINFNRETDDLVIFTPEYDASTGTDNSGVEVVVDIGGRLVIKPSPANVSGTVVEIRDLQGDTRLPFDHIVLSATGSKRTTLLANVQLGDTIEISQEIRNLTTDCSSGDGSLDWTKSYSSIGGNFTFLKGGVKQSTTNAGLINEDPRTAIAYNGTHVFFIVVDGRQSSSIGMSMDQLGDFCLNSLGATDGTNQDGGGSSAMWVNGAIVNSPSDGSERAVANGMMMISLVENIIPAGPFGGDGYAVSTTASTPLRQGPGTNYNSFTTISSGTIGEIVDHSLNGTSAKGSNWWKVDFGSDEGWVLESALQSELTDAKGWHFYE